MANIKDKSLSSSKHVGICRAHLTQSRVNKLTKTCEIKTMDHHPIDRILAKINERIGVEAEVEIYKEQVLEISAIYQKIKYLRRNHTCVA